MIIRRFRCSALLHAEEELTKRRLQEAAPEIEAVRLEHCFYVEIARPLDPHESAILDWLLSETFEPGEYGPRSHLHGMVLEVGPRVEIVTPWSTNAVKICHACGLSSVKRLERSRRYQIVSRSGAALGGGQVERICALLHDRMTEAAYPRPLTTFDSQRTPPPVRTIPLIEEGVGSLDRLNLALDGRIIEHDSDYFLKAGINPTDVELMHLDQTQSDHSRHRTFNAAWFIDGAGREPTLMGMIKANHLRHPGDSLVAFEDNASVIRGHGVEILKPADPAAPSKITSAPVDMCITAKCESHNHPTAIVSPAGAGTGTGGRIRDNQTVGRGGTPVAGSTLYLVGNLLIPGYGLPWEARNWDHPGQLETPLQIILGAPRGAYRYGNEFGEPAISGSTTSFEHVHEEGGGVELFGYTKCGMWTVGLGWVDRRHLRKQEAQRGLHIVQLGGDAYRIGLGGASGSSKIAGAQEAELDWNSVQRANAEMEKVVDRVIGACVMLGDDNPISSIHDLGAGGDSNAVSEIIFPAGGTVYLRRLPSGDNTMSALEIWCNESQERVVLLTNDKGLDVLKGIAVRERCPLAVIGEVTGDGRVVVVDEAAPPDAPRCQKEPVNLDLGFALGRIPQLVLHDGTVARRLRTFGVHGRPSVREALDRVLRLLKVCSKGFLVNHVDRSVTGLVAGQQCAGPLQLPVGDVAVAADSHLGVTGRCWGIGDQPVKWIVDPQASVRLAVSEALTNLVWAQVGRFDGISLLADWGIAASEPGEGARLFQANLALNAFLGALGLSINGGKDSMSMAAGVSRQGVEATVKAPGTLVVTAYAACPDITRTITPDIKRPGQSSLLFIDLSGGKSRLGGSALAQVYGQVGDEAPDVDDPRLLRKGFEAVQDMIREGVVLAGHDRSDGGLITCLLEMAFAGDCGLDIEFDVPRFGAADALDLLFNEEPGLVIEYLPRHEGEVRRTLREHGMAEHCAVIGGTCVDKAITLRHGGLVVLPERTADLREVWQETSYRLERLQANPGCAESERQAGRDSPGLRFHLTFDPTSDPVHRGMTGPGHGSLADSGRNAGADPGGDARPASGHGSPPDSRRNTAPAARPKVAILREEGTNGDREMAAAFFAAGFEPWDVTMTDLAAGRAGLKGFRGVAFCGGFSYGDVLDAGKGWAGMIRFNTRVRQEFDAFYERPDTFSLGVCNGCQVMALLGWVPRRQIDPVRQPRFVFNDSAMFESRFLAVKVLPSPSVLLDGMENSVLGIWVAHGEGRFHCGDEAAIREIEGGGLAPLRYADSSGMITERYPSNPNGSGLGIAALCSADGRHLAMMPHPERVFLRWQWPYWPREWDEMNTSPWLRLFRNARRWCGAQEA